MSKIIKTRLLLIIFPCCFLSAQITAHHAFTAEFDPNAPVELEGVVTRVELINPHAWIHIDVTDEDGAVTAWMIEGGTPNTLLRRGLTPAALPIGSQVVVQGYQSRDQACNPSCKANGRDVTFPDGRQVFMGSAGIGAPPPVQ